MAQSYRKTNPLLHYGILGTIYLVGILTLAGHTALHAITQPAHTHDAKASLHEQDYCQDTPDQSHTVTFSSKGVVPASLTIKRCDEIVIVNNLDREIIPAVGSHTRHAIYPGFTETILAPGEKYTFQATSTGTYPLHDHENDSLAATLTIE